jgi:hypothetical protein
VVYVQLAVESPELPALAEELSERIGELRQKINPIKELLKQVRFGLVK